MTPLAKIAIFGHPPSEFCTPPHHLSTASLRADRKSVRIASLSFAFLFRYFSRLDQTNFSRFRRTLTLVSTVGFAIEARLTVDFSDLRDYHACHGEEAKLS